MPRRADTANAIRTRLRREGRDVVDLRADADWLREYTDHPSQLLADMARRKLAHRIQRGRYHVNTVDDMPSESPLLDALEPIARGLLEGLGMAYYLSWHTALFHYGLLEQQASTVYCAVPRRKRSATFFGFTIQFVTLNQDRFFGIEPAREYSGTVRIAVVEKALLDAVERPDLTAPFAVILNAFAEAAASGMLNPERLVDFTIATRRPSLTRRIGFLMERHGLQGSEPLLEHIGARAPESLLPGGERSHGELDRRWRLRVPPQLLATAERLK